MDERRQTRQNSQDDFQIAPPLKRKRQTRQNSEDDFEIAPPLKRKISPIELAVETMKSTKKDIRDLIIAHQNDQSIPINSLSMKINGIVDPAVMGGFSKYEEAFLSNDYLEEHPDDSELVETLKDLIASQIPLLEIAIALHKHKAPDSLKLFHERLESCFTDMQANVESKYGKKSYDLKLDRDSVILRRNGAFMPIMFDDTNRLSETSMGSSDSKQDKTQAKRRASNKKLDRETIISASNTSLSSSKTTDPRVLTEESIQRHAAEWMRMNDLTTRQNSEDNFEIAPALKRKIKKIPTPGEDFDDQPCTSAQARAQGNARNVTKKNKNIQKEVKNEENDTEEICVLKYSEVQYEEEIGSENSKHKFIYPKGPGFLKASSKS